MYYRVFIDFDFRFLWFGLRGELPDLGECYQGVPWSSVVTGKFWPVQYNPSQSMAPAEYRTDLKATGK